MSARELEEMLREAQVVRADSQVRCEPADRDWNYVCNHMPTPQQSAKRLQFGISVDASRCLAASAEVPLETDVPPPAGKSTRRLYALSRMAIRDAFSHHRRFHAR